MECAISLEQLGAKQNRFTEDECYQLWQMLEYQSYDLRQTDIVTLTKLVELFGKAYWDSDTAIDESVFLTFLKELSEEKIKDMIPLLVTNSNIYPTYMKWAAMLMSSLPETAQKQVHVHPHKLADEAIGTFISKAEFDYRTRKGLDCFLYDNKYCRKIVIDDLQCFYISMEIALETGQASYIYIP
jgi:hypothetical protein